MSDLMLIESPNKIRSISKYIDSKKIKLFATYGHIRDLSTWNLGFNTSNYEIHWVNSKQTTKHNNKEIKIIDLINDEAKKADNIYLSTDPDREGEAIAWHVFCLLSKENQKKCKRVVFNEITKKAIEESFKHQRDLNDHQINSYLARRLLDRFIGFKLSSYTKKKIGGISAGRVQSIALKFLKDKEEEIKNFIPEKWFNLQIILDNELILNLKKISLKFLPIRQNKNIKNNLINFEVKEEAEKISKSLEPTYKLIEICDPQSENKSAPNSFKTSNLYEKAINKLNMTSKQVEKTAQKLYEGVEIDGEIISLITYPRTDRADFSEDFLSLAKNFIIETYSEKYWKGQVVKTKKEDLVQGAHEGIRPTDILLKPESVKKFLPDFEYRLYELIWVYTICSLMTDTIYEKTTCKFENNKHIFQTNLYSEKFDGYKKLMKNYKFQTTTRELEFPLVDLVLNEIYKPKEVKILEVNKKPPTPYNEATLIKSLEEKGIGRPSTYATIANVVLNREYALKEKNYLNITPLGNKVSEDLEINFSNFIHYDYTRQMEKELDNIADNKTNWKDFLNSVFEIFNQHLTKAATTIPAKVYEKVEDRKCSDCGKDLVYKFSHKNNNKFIGCLGYPECKYVESINNEENKKVSEVVPDKKCSDCGKDLVYKFNRKNNDKFIGCSGYPECKYVESINNKGNKRISEVVPDKNCQQCGKNLVYKFSPKIKKRFMGCSGYPECKYVEWINNFKKNNKNKSLDE